MRISYDPAKRQKTFDERGLDFEDAPEVFSGLTFELEDTRQDYGETRMICFGHLAGRLIVVGYTPRGAVRHVFSIEESLMNANKPVSAPTLKSDLKRVDAHKPQANEYEALPELTDAMLKRGTVKRAGRPVATNPRRQVTIRLPESVLAQWKATGPGWQTRMANLLSKRAS